MTLDTLKYASSHEWLSLDGNTAVVGITDFAVKTLTDLIFLELPEADSEVTAGESFGEVESVKAVSELLAPASGRIVEVNTAVADDLSLLSADPFGKGWLIKIELSNPSELDALLDRTAYEKRCSEDEH